MNTKEIHSRGLHRELLFALTTIVVLGAVDRTARRLAPGQRGVGSPLHRATGFPFFSFFSEVSYERAIRLAPEQWLG